MSKLPRKVVLEKTSTLVEVTEGSYTKRELRKLLLSSLSLLKATEYRKVELMRLSGVDPDDIQRIKDGRHIGTDGKELLGEVSKNSAALRLIQLIGKEEKRGIENRFVDLLRSKGVSDDLLNRILMYGLSDEIIRLLKALGLTDEEIAQLLGMSKALFDGRSESEKSCLSVRSSGQENMSPEGIYLMSGFKNLLTKALADIVCKMPSNPAEYLGHWLLNYEICEERAQKQREYDAELQVERERSRIKVQTPGPPVSEQDEEEGEMLEDWNFMEYEAD